MDMKDFDLEMIEIQKYLGHKPCSCWKFTSRGDDRQVLDPMPALFDGKDVGYTRQSVPYAKLSSDQKLIGN